MVFHGFWLVSMVFQGDFMVFHGFGLVSIVLLVENTTTLYPGPKIQSRPCRQQAGFGLVFLQTCKSTCFCSCQAAICTHNKNNNIRKSRVGVTNSQRCITKVSKGKVHGKKSKKELTSVSFMYVCVAENAELLVFFLLFFYAPSPK